MIRYRYWTNKRPNNSNALAANRVRCSDLIQKKCEATAFPPSTVKSAVLETTGLVSILQGETAGPFLREGARRI
jgi:uncharacterized membrane protein YcaP (DUF421 family)